MVNMNLDTPRGTRDLLPNETYVRNEVYRKIREVFESYGYGEVETPAFENFELLAAKSGPEIEEEIYAFEDKGGRKLGLRFDPTVPIARIVASDSSKPKPIKYYYITRMWRYEKPQQGRWREFWQAGCELIGPSSVEADAEILKLAQECLKRVTDTEFVVKINSREVMDELAAQAGVKEEDKDEVFRALDKLDKKTQEEVEEELVEKNVELNGFRAVLTKIEKGEVDCESDERLMKIKKKAEEIGVENVEVDYSIMRGLDYYTGFIFEVLVKGSENIGSVCSGGRYDSLIGIYGKEDVPATGFGLGVDRLLEVAELTESDSLGYFQTDFYVVPVNESSRKDALKLTQVLRESGFRVDTDLMERDLSKQMKYINSMNIPYALVMGPREIENSEVTLKNMGTGEQIKVKLNLLKEKLMELTEY